MLSNALERSNNTKAVTCLRNIAFKARSDIKILSVSVECHFLFPLWCPLRQFLLIAYSVNWFKATRSHILDRAGNNDTGLFPLATSRTPPSFRIGTISESFHDAGNTDVKSELFRTGYTKAQAFSIRDLYIFLSGTECFWTGTQYFSQDETPETKKSVTKRDMLQALRQKCNEFIFQGKRPTYHQGKLSLPYILWVYASQLWL